MKKEESDKLAVVEKLPRGMEFLRAAVSAIPYVGGPLDHLMFDRAGEIRVKNLTISIEALSSRLKDVEEKLIDREWFESEEALSAMKILADKIGFEPDKEKVQALGKVVAICGLNENVHDPEKLQVLEYIGNFSYSQIELLKVIDSIHPIERTFSRGALKEKRTAIWTTEIIEIVKLFYPGILRTYMTDVEILESRNTIRKIQTIVPDTTGGGYLMTEIGKIAAKYLNSAEPSKKE